ncbi:hypothetical protein VTO42DRAFT_3949 [Malbranchea cinnamomea]
MWLISYWVFPVIAAGMWLATLLTLIIRWAVDDFPHYPSMEPNQSIAYISDIGAQGLKPLFITGSVITGVFFNLAFISERWLRHTGRLLRNKNWLDKSLALLSIVFAIWGTIGLILLSIFDTLRHPHAHNGFLVMFMGGYLLSAIFVCLEYLRLGIHYKDHIILTISFWVKLTFIVVELALSIAFGICIRGTRKNQGAVLEWVIAYIFTFYILSFVIDLLPAVRTRRRIPQGERLTEMAEAGTAGAGVRYPRSFAGPHNQPQPEAIYEQPLTTDSMGDAANTYRGYHVRGAAPTAWPGRHAAG